MNRTLQALSVAVLILVLSAMSPGVGAQASDIRFDSTITEACLADSDPGTARFSCIGLAAQACMNATPDAYTTVGMTDCLSREHDFWDTRLNAVYQKLLAQNAETEAEMAEIDAHVPPLVTPLREMQRAWIPYRDAACGYEYATWGGGTGGGPASVDCSLQLTALQTLRLENYIYDN